MCPGNGVDLNYDKDFNYTINVKPVVSYNVLYKDKVLFDEEVKFQDKVYNGLNRVSINDSFEVDFRKILSIIPNNLLNIEDSVISIKVDIKLDSEIYFDFKHEFTKHIEVDIPYKKVFTVESERLKEESKVSVPISSSKALKASLVLSTLSLVVITYFLINYLIKLLKMLKLNNYERIIRKIKANYSDNIIELEELPDFGDREVLEVKTLFDLETVYQETKELINACETKKNKELQFFVITGETVYVYKVLNK